jgi:hypothetical protein
MFATTRPGPLAASIALHFATHKASLSLALIRFKRP